MPKISSNVNGIVKILVTVAGRFHDMNPIPDCDQDRIVNRGAPLYGNAPKVRGSSSVVGSNLLHLKQNNVAGVQLRGSPKDLVEEAVPRIEEDGSDSAPSVVGSARRAPPIRQTEHRPENPSSVVILGNRCNQLTAGNHHSGRW